MTNEMQKPEDISWEWKDDDDAAAAGDTDAGRVVFTASAPDAPAELKLVDAGGDVIWARQFPDAPANSAALLHDRNRLYAVLFISNATGGRVAALDAGSGGELWMTRLEGVGPILHSKYANLIRLKLSDGWLVVFGRESGGKYIEVFNAESGERLHHRRVDD